MRQKDSEMLSKMIRERNKRRRRKKAVGADREECTALFTRGRDYNRSMGCHGSHQSNEGLGHILSFSRDEKQFQ